MKEFFTAKRLCRAGIIAALYVAFTYSFGAIAYTGFLQIRPSEALCLLPLFFPEAIPALYIGCMIGNLGSPFLIYDVFIGSLATLLAAFCSYFIGRSVKRKGAKIALGGLFPVLFNALIIPFVIVVLCKDTSSYGTALTTYFVYTGSIAATEAVWVYALGAPLCIFIDRMRAKNVAAFCDLPLSPSHKKQKVEKTEL